MAGDDSAAINLDAVGEVAAAGTRGNLADGVEVDRGDAVRGKKPIALGPLDVECQRAGLVPCRHADARRLEDKQVGEGQPVADAIGLQRNRGLCQPDGARDIAPPLVEARRRPGEAGAIGGRDGQGKRPGEGGGGLVVSSREGQASRQVGQRGNVTRPVDARALEERHGGRGVAGFTQQVGELEA